MAEKEGGDSEKKMTKDFLDRWKRIASKYETPEEEAARAKAAGQSKPPEAQPQTDLEQAAREGAPPPPPPEHGDEEELELDDLMVDFGLQGDEDAKPRHKPAAPEAARPSPPAVAAAPRTPPAPPALKPPVEDAQKRVLDTLKKVGLVKEGTPAAPAPPPPPEPEQEEEDTLLLELENLLSDEPAAPAPGKPAAAAARATLEEEDLIAELEGLLEGTGEEEAAAPTPRVAPVKPVEAAPVTIETKSREFSAAPPAFARADIMPPEAPKARPESAAELAGGRTNGGRVNGGRVNGGRVNGGRVNGGRVNGGRVNGGRVNGGRVNGGRVNGGRVNGGRVNGGRVNGGRVNGGGQTNGGRVNGSRVNGGRGGMIGGAAPVLRAQNRRQFAISAMVAFVVAFALVVTLPFAGAPRGPAVDGDMSDWAGSGALLYTDAADGGTLPPALDLREYALRVDATRLWFEANASAPLFTRSGPFPPRADYFMVLLDTDGSAGTGYSYHGLGIDRIVDVYGWNGTVKAFATREWANRPNVPAYDFSGFQTAGGLQVAIRGDRIEGSLTAIATEPLTDSLRSVRALFELRGADPSGTERIDGSPAPATLSGSSLSATVTPVAPSVLAQGASANAPMLSISLANPSPTAVQVTALQLTAQYAPTAPADLSTVSLYRDRNGNSRVDAPAEEKLSGAATPLPQGAAATVTFAPALSILAGEKVDVLAVIEHVSSNAVNGSSLRLSLSGASEVVASTGTLVNFIRAPVAIGAQPLSYFGGAPNANVVDGNPLEWQGRPSSVDPADNANAHIDLRSLQGNVTPTEATFLVTVGSTPLDGSLVPIKFASAIELPSTGGGGGGSNGPPAVPPPTSGADVLWIMIDGDNDTATGSLFGGHGYDYAIRIEGKGGEVLPGGGSIFSWNTTGSPGWAALAGVAPQVGVGASSVEVGAALPPLILTARNVTVTAYATDWQGARDDLAAPLVVNNGQGTRGQLEPITPDNAPAAENPPVITPIPEFQDLAAPAAAVLIIIGMSRRSRRIGSVN